MYLPIYFYLRYILGQKPSGFFLYLIQEFPLYLRYFDKNKMPSSCANISIGYFEEIYFSYLYHRMQYMKKKLPYRNFFLCRFQHSDADFLYLKGNTAYNAYILLTVLYLKPW